MTSVWPSFGLIALAFAFAAGCAAQRRQQPSTPFTAVVGPAIVAHRGGSLEVPENTVEAVRHGVGVGADWQEIDVTLSMDDEVIVIHDDSTERTTGVSGRVEEMTAAELTALPAGRPAWSDYGRAKLEERGLAAIDFGDAFADAKVPRLSEVLAVPGGRLMIEMKATERVDDLAARVIEVVRDAGAEDRVALGSLDDRLLYAAYGRAPSLPLIGVVNEAERIDVMLQLPIAVLAVAAELTEQALAAAPPTVAVWTWTAYTVADAEAARELGVHGIITDAPQAVVNALRAEPSLYVEPSKP
jgi:glycerophosphoryl diester phosphodiesterase